MNGSELFSIHPSQAPLVGIARLAAASAHLGDGHEVEYREMECRSLLNRTSARMPFHWTVNPYRGCEFACHYCYARYTHEFMEIHDGREFERKIFAKAAAAERLRADLRKVKAGEIIAIGTATDPYQPAERKYRLTRSILEMLSNYSDLSIGIVSKSQLIARDLDVLAVIDRKSDLSVSITITTIDVDLARKLEPRAPRPDLRLRALRRLRAAGIRAGVLCAPVLPGITDLPSSLDSLVGMAASAGALWVHANPLFLKPCSEKIFLPFIAQHFRHLEEAYRKRYGTSAYVSKAYRERIKSLMDALRRKHGIADARERFAHKQPPRQASLFESADAHLPPAVQQLSFE